MNVAAIVAVGLPDLGKKNMVSKYPDDKEEKRREKKRKHEKINKNSRKVVNAIIIHIFIYCLVITYPALVTWSPKHQKDEFSGSPTAGASSLSVTVSGASACKPKLVFVCFDKPHMLNSNQNRNNKSNTKTYRKKKKRKRRHGHVLFLSSSTTPDTLRSIAGKGVWAKIAFHLQHPSHFPCFGICMVTQSLSNCSVQLETAF